MWRVIIGDCRKVEEKGKRERKEYGKVGNNLGKGYFKLRLENKSYEIICFSYIERDINYFIMW